MSLLLLLFSSLTQAQQSSVMVTIDGQTTSVKNKVGFVKLDDDAKAAVIQISLPIPAGTKATNATGDGVVFKKQWQKTPGRAMVGIGAFKTDISIELDNGQTVSAQATVKLAKTLLKEEGCKDLGLKMSGKNLTKIPLFIGVKCEKTKDRSLLHVSVPQELQWEATNIFEISGKGERWKVYDLSQIGLRDAGNQLATFNFRWENESFALVLIQTKGQKAAQNTPPPAEALVKIRGGVGVANVSYTTPKASGGGVAPLIYLDALSKAYAWNLKARTAVKFAMPLTGQKFYEFSFATGPTWGNFSLFGEYLAVGQEESDAGVTFSHSHFGVNLMYKINMTSSSVTIAANYNGLGGDSTHMGFNIYYDRGNTLNQRTWGLLLGYQMQSASDIRTSNTSDFSQIVGAGTYSF